MELKSFFFLFSFFSNAVSTEEDPIWCLEKHETHGHLFWRRDSSTSKVKFKHDVEILEFVRDPEEDFLVSHGGHYNHMIGERKPTHPIVVISTCICAIAVTVLLPWFMIQSNEPLD